MYNQHNKTTFGSFPESGRGNSSPPRKRNRSPDRASILAGHHAPSLTSPLRKQANTTGLRASRGSTLRASAVSKLSLSTLSFPSQPGRKESSSPCEMERDRIALRHTMPEGTKIDDSSGCTPEVKRSGSLILRRKPCEEKEEISRAKAQEMATRLEVSDVRDTDLNKVASVKTSSKECVNAVGAKEAHRRYTKKEKESRKQQTKRLAEDPLLTPSQIRERQKLYDQQRRKEELKRKSHKVGTGFLIGIGAGMGLTTLAKSAERDTHHEQRDTGGQGSQSSPRSVATTDSLDRFLNGCEGEDDSSHKPDDVELRSYQASPGSSLTLSDEEPFSSQTTLESLDDGMMDGTTAALAPVAAPRIPPVSVPDITRLSSARMRKRALEEQRAAMRNGGASKQQQSSQQQQKSKKSATSPAPRLIRQGSTSSSQKARRTQTAAAPPTSHNNNPPSSAQKKKWRHDKSPNVVGPGFKRPTDQDGNFLYSSGLFGKKTPHEQREIAKSRATQLMLETEAGAAGAAASSSEQQHDDNNNNSRAYTHKGHTTTGGRSLSSSGVGSGRYHGVGGRLHGLTSSSASYSKQDERKKKSLVCPSSSSGKRESDNGLDLPALC